MARYLALYLNDGVTSDGRRIVSSRGLQTMLAPGLDATLGPWADHVQARYAMGWYVGGPWSEPARLHPGRAPDSSSLIVVFPRRDLAVVTLTNAANQLAVPGYPASIDRVERNAVGVLTGVAARAAAGVLLVALPALTFGWRASFLWQPDLATVIVLLGALLLLSAALRLATLVRPADTRAWPTAGDRPRSRELQEATG